MTTVSTDLQRMSRTPDQPKAAAVQATERREKGLWTFLTWSFFLSQAIAADQALAASARAAQDGDESSRADHGASDAFRAAPAVFAPSASVDSQEPGTKAPPQALAAAPATTPLHLPEPSAFGGARDAHHSDGGAASQHASTAFWSPGSGAAQVVSIKPHTPGQAPGGAQPGGGTQPGGGNPPTVIPEPPGGGGSGGNGPGLPGPIGEILDPILDPVVDILEPVLDPIVDIVDGLVPPVLGIVDGVVNPIVELVDDLVPPVLAIVDGLLDPVQDVVEGVLDGVVHPVVGSVASIVDSVVEPVLGTVTDVVDNVVSPVLGVVEGVVGPTIGVVSGVVDNVVQVIEPVVDGIVTPVVDLVADVVQDAAGIVEPIVDQVVAPLLGTVGDVVGTVTDTLEPVVDSAVGPAVDVVGDVAGTVTDTLELVVDSAVGPAVDVVGDVAGTVTDIIQPIVDTAVETGTSVTEALGSAVQDAGALAGAAQSIVADPLGELLGLGSDSSTAILVSAGVSSGQSLDFGAQVVLADYEIFSSGSYTDYGLTLQAEQDGPTNVTAGASLGTPADLDALTIATGANDPEASSATSTLPILSSVVEDTGLRGMFDGLGL
jgi:hypothetical protein